MIPEVAIVTGATGGIGKSVASTLAEHGHPVLALGRNIEVLDALEASCHGLLRGRAVDLLLDESVDALVDEITREYQAVRALVHCAGAYYAGPLADTPARELDVMYRTNVRAPFRLTSALTSLLERGKGYLIFVNSSAGLAARAGAGAYSATHFAARALADCWRAELNQRGVRVLTIHPGRTATPLSERIFALEGREFDPRLLLQPRDVAQIVLAALELPETAELTEVSLRPARKSY